MCVSPLESCIFITAALELKRAAIREAASRFRAANPRIFGSVLHGTDEEGSDLDLLVDAFPGVPVELLTPGDLPPRFRDQVLAEARSV